MLTWRWAPCLALVLGSVSFVAFALVAIPDRIGHVEAENTTDGLRLGVALARTQSPSTAANDWSGDTTNTAAATPSPGLRSTQSSTGTPNADGSFPKRGFSPPLERPEPPPAPAVAAPPPLQLNVPPPVPAPPSPPAAEPPAPAPQPEVVPQAAPAPAPAEAPPASAGQAPPPSAGQAPVAASSAN